MNRQARAIVEGWEKELVGEVVGEVSRGEYVFPPDRPCDMSPPPDTIKRGNPFSPSEMLCCLFWVGIDNITPLKRGRPKRDIHPLGPQTPSDGGLYGGQGRPRLSGEELATRLATFQALVEAGGDIPAMEGCDPPRATPQFACRQAMLYGEAGLLNKYENDNRRSHWQAVLEYAWQFEKDWNEDEREFISLMVKREYRQ